MNSYNWMAWKALFPALALIAGSLLLVLLAPSADQPLLGNIREVFGVASLALLIGGSLLGAYRLYAIYRCLNGEGLLCDCGGMLGSERSGRWGRFRPCLKCKASKSTPAPLGGVVD